ncbi:MAG: Rid family detoxifying hydrolase [Actinomycetota bacterium]
MPASPVPTPSAPPVAGPYSPAARAGDLVFLAGQIALDPATGALVEGDIERETRQALANIAAILGDLGAAWTDVVKTTIFLAGSLEYFATVNECYAEAVGEHRPARSTVAVAALPLGAAVEIEVVVHRPA